VTIKLAIIESLRYDKIQAPRYDIKVLFLILRICVGVPLEGPGVDLSYELKVKIENTVSILE
jgi:hypothetical protein